MFTDSINRAATMAQIVFGPATGSGSASTAVLRFGAATYVGSEAQDLFTIVDTAADGTRVVLNRVGLYLAELIAPCAADAVIRAGILSGPIANSLVADPGFVNANAAVVDTVASVLSAYNGTRTIANIGAVIAPNTFQVAASVTNNAAGAPAAALVVAQTVFKVTFLGPVDPG